MRAIVYAVIAIAVVIGAYVGYLWLTYIDETTTSGEAYGFVIGEGKLDTYNKAAANLTKLKSPRSIIYIEVESDAASARVLAVKPGHKVLVQALLHDVGFPTFQVKNQWDFYFDGSYFNKLSLRFCNEQLCEIYRHRKFFEFP